MTSRIVACAIVSLSALVAAGAASAQPPKNIREQLQTAQRAQNAASTLHGFSISLVIGELQGGTAADNVPAAARKALSDMKDFLPYKSYRLVDSSWILSLQSGRWAVSRLGGPGNEQYEVTLSPMPNKTGPPQELHLSFRLRQTESVDDGSRRASLVNQEVAELKTNRAMLETLLAKMKEQSGERQSELAKAQERLLHANQRIAALESGAPPTARTVTLIDTNFAMDVGETVVVGTSRVQGDKALIALLTAVPRASK